MDKVSLKTYLQQGFGWWVSGLQTWLPESFALKNKASPVILLDIDSDEQAILSYRHASDKVISTHTYFFDDFKNKQSVESWLNKYNHCKVALIIEQRYLLKRFKLPISAKGKLESVLRFELERQTPFLEKSVYWTYRVEAILERELKIVLAVIPKEIVGNSLIRFQNLNLKVDEIHISPPNAPPLVIPLSDQHKPAKDRKKMIVCLMAINILLFLVYLYQPVLKYAYATDNLEAKLSNIKIKAKRVVDLERENGEMRHELTEIRNRINGYRLKTKLLSDLTNILDDQVWLESVYINDGEIRIRGYAKSIAQLTQKLSQVSAYSDIQLNESSPFHTKHEDKKYFDIRILLKKQDIKHA